MVYVKNCKPYYDAQIYNFHKVISDYKIIAMKVTNYQVTRTITLEKLDQ